MTTTDLPSATAVPASAPGPRGIPSQPPPATRSRAGGGTPRSALFWLVLLWVTALWVQHGGVQDLGSLAGAPHQHRAAHRPGRLGPAAGPGVPHGARAVVRAGLGPGRAGAHPPARSGSRRSTCCGRTSCSSPSGMPRPPRLGLWGTIVDFVVQLPRDAAGRGRHGRALPGRRHLGAQGPAPAALRVVAPHPPLRLPRCRAGAAAPAVDRPGVPRLDRRRRSSGGACMPCAAGGRPRLPRGRAAVALAARAAASSTPCGPRGQAPRVSRSSRARRRRTRPWRRASSSSGASSTGPAGAGPTPTPCRRHPTARPCASPPPTSATGRARLAALQPGTRVLVEGPYGRMHPGVRTRRKVLLMGAGIGITPHAGPARGPAPGPGRRHRRPPGEHTGPARARPMRSAHWPHSAAPATSSSRGPRLPGRDTLAPAQAAHLSDAEALPSSCPTWPSATSSSAAPLPWMEAARQAALDCGVPPEHIHLERFAY